MGQFQPGNQVAAVDKRFKKALNAALDRVKSRQEGLQVIDDIAESMVKACFEADPKDRLAAIRELRDTLDGKPHQSIGGEDGGPMVFILRDMAKECGKE